MTTDVTSYTELIAGINAQREALGVRMSDFDDLAGFPAGLTGKAFGMLQVKRLGPEKLFDAIRAAGLRIKLEVDPDQVEKMKQRISENYNPRQSNQARANNHASTISTQVLSRAFGHVLRKARKNRWAGKSQKERSDHARAIANTRWKRHRKRAAAAKKGAQTRKQRLALAAPQIGATGAALDV